MTAHSAILSAVACVLLASTAMAQELGSPLLTAKPWTSLSTQQQQVLQPLAAQWSEMDGANRDKWVALAARYPTMGAEEQGRMRSRVQEWAKLSLTQRQQARDGFQTAQRKSEDERAAKWAAYQQLSIERRLALQERGAHRQSQLAAMTLARPVSPQLPVLVQVQPGASTVMLTQRQALQPAPWVTRHGSPLRAQWAEVDAATLMPRASESAAKPAASATIQQQ